MIKDTIEISSKTQLERIDHDCLSRVTIVNIRDSYLRHFDLSPLSNCTQLKVLDLSDNLLTQLDLSPLSNCTQLQEIKLSRNKLTQLDLPLLSIFRKLEKLNLGYNPFTELDISLLNSCPQLHDLSLNATNLTKFDFSLLSNYMQIKTLDISENPFGQLDLSPLGSWSHLEGLYLVSTSLTELDLSPLGSCTKLRWLDLCCNDIIKLDLSPLNPCKKLVSLELDGNPLTLVYLSPFWYTASDGLQKAVWKFSDLIMTNAEDLLTHPELDLGDAARGIYQVGAPIEGDTMIRYRLRQYLSDQYDADFCNFHRDLMEDYLNRGCSTVFLEIDSFSTTEASRLVPRILELRELENKRVMEFVPKPRYDTYDLSDIVSCYTVEKLLCALEYGVKVNKEELKILQNQFHRINIMVNWI
ncbi:MAG: hypothetical protein BAJATHORv1_40364 [Candidatus Thorarchaeota archaeon]|nr:MAG: hypothetical protein BAJATHORv1_40364 [Candidatus Thorarchaeota archaeon]